jgi:hypothetical protein
VEFETKSNSLVNGSHNEAIDKPSLAGEDDEWLFTPPTSPATNSSTTGPRDKLLRSNSEAV